MSPSLRLYELAGAHPDVRFSPYCWRVRLALAHKGLPVQTIAWRFSDKAVIEPSGQGKVPVLVAGEDWLSDSWAIAEYLERTYADGPSLFGQPDTHALTRFVQQWANDTLHPALARVVMPDIHAILAEQDKDYFKRTREAAFGTTLEALVQAREASLAALAVTLKPLRSTLQSQAFLAGDAPAYADHIVFGSLQWARVVSPAPLFESNPQVWAWFERMLDAYDGLGRRAPLAYAA